MKKPKAPRLVTVAIFTTITVIFWIFLSVYEILTTKVPVDVPPELLESITPDLDIEALDSIPQRMFFFEEDVNFVFQPIDSVTLQSTIQPQTSPEPPDAIEPTATTESSPATGPVEEVPREE